MDPDIRVRVALDSDPTDPAPDWTDISARVHYGDGGQEVKVTSGRQNEQADIRPTEMSWAVRNGDNAMTPNNSASPYAGRWEQGRRVQIAEVVDGEEFLLGTGFLEIPDMQIVDPRSSQPVAVTAVDWMGRMESAPPFEGTLAEHVRAEGGTLVEHFPLTDSYPHASSQTTAVLSRVVVGFDTSVVAEPEPLIEASGLAGPPGDDQSYARWAPVSDGTAFLARARLDAPVDVQVGATDTLAVSLWLHPQADANGYDYTGTIFNLFEGTLGVPGVTLTDLSDSLQFRWRTAGGTTSLLAGRRPERDAWRLITMRVNAATGALDFWSGADLVVSDTVTAPGAFTLTAIQIGTLFVGGIGHVQVRVGPSGSTMTRAMHLAQHEHAYRGLHRQTVAERITTLAGYAGVPATEVDIPAACSTPMQVARLAGAGPADALRAAARTGQDLLVTDGAGRLTAVPRAQQYNQAVKLAIPFGWIGYRGLRYRPDKPVTDVTVTRTGGGTVRRSDRARAERYGVTAQQYELDTAVDEDPANLAAWALTAHGQSRTRAPSIRIDMLRRTAAERKALLGLREGDRIEITGLPAGSPDDVGHLIVQGRQHTIGPGRRRFIELNTSPLLGPAPGVPPASPMVGGDPSTDLVVNGTFTDGTAGWVGQNATIAPSTEHTREGGSLLVTPNGSSASGGVIADGSAAAPVTAEAVYQAGIWVYATSAMQLGPAVDWLDGTGAYMSTSFVGPVTVPAGELTEVAGAVTAPVGAAWAVARARHAGTPTGAHTWWLSEISLLEATVASNSAVIAY